LKELIDKVRDLDELTPEALEQRIQEIKTLKSEIDFEESLEDFSALLEDIKHGADRTTEIVKGLRDFSRIDAGEYNMADIHEGIDSTLMLLRNKMANVEVIKNYDKHLSQIMCYPSELNQVFMNLIGNAIDAMDAKGKLEISTKDFGKEIHIIAQDSSVGIPQSVIDKVFEPFFTTKDIGKGTGLGLSISHGIVQKHNGELLVESEEEKGTKFTILLPKNKENNK
jgi:signal transduction histidine kinase